MAKVDDRVAVLEQTVNEMQDSIRKLFQELSTALEIAGAANNGLTNLREQVKKLAENKTEMSTTRFK
jgi:phage shock protein A